MSYRGSSGPALVIRHTGQVFPLTETPVTIGRASDNDVVLSDQQVSRHHATLFRRGDTFYVQDLESANGTYLNEQRIPAPRPLRHGYVLRMGNTIFDVQLAAAADPDRPMSAPRGEAGAYAAEPGRSLAPLIIGLLIAGIVVVGLALAALLFLAGGSRNKPMVTIQSPPAGTQIAAGTEVILQATATGARNLTRLEISIDGTLIAVEASSDPRGQASLTASQPWTFAQAGTHVVSAMAYTARGRTSDPTTINVAVAGIVAQETPSPTSQPSLPTATASTTPLPTVPPPTEPPTGTPLPEMPSDTPLPPLSTDTATPTPTPTDSPTPTPTETRLSPPQIEFFQVNPSSILAGQCTTLEWGAVTNATEATIDQGIGGVATPGSRNVCPPETTTYILTATGPGGVTTAATMVTVSAAQPDLTVVSITFSPSPPAYDRDNEVRITIRNQGSLAAGPFAWQFRPGPEPILSGNVQGLNAAETMLVTAIWKPSATYPDLSATAVVDAGNAVGESNENNNELTVNTAVVEPSEVTVERTGEAALDGFRSSDDDGSDSLEIRVGNGNFVGDPPHVLVTRGFMSFDLSGIPAGATVQGVQLRFYQVQVQGNPFDKLGHLLLKHVDYGPSLEADDYDGAELGSFSLPYPLVSGEWYIVTSDVLGDWIEQDLTAGRTRSQFRLQFTTETDVDGVDDMVYIESGDNALGTGNLPQLTFTYQP
jgi:hypothetical protein